MTYKIPTSFSAGSPSSGNPKYKSVPVQTERSWSYSNKMLKMLELGKYVTIDLRVYVKGGCDDVG
jgi:hypothetical protein